MPKPTPGTFRKGKPSGDSRRRTKKAATKGGRHEASKNVRRESRLPKTTDPVTLTITEIGAKGDGIARLEGVDKPYYVPLAAPGDRIIARPTAETTDFIRATLLELLQPGQDRRQAPCPLFGPCGGCQVQHLSEDRYTRFKQELVQRALNSHGLKEAPVRPIKSIAPGSRRRATVFGRVLAAGPVLGFLEAGSHRIVNLDQCPLLTDKLNALLDALRVKVLPQIAAGGSGSFTLLDQESGVDLTIQCDEEPTLDQRRYLVEIAEELDLARVSWATGAEPPEPIAERRAPVMTLSDVPVLPPPTAFTQVSAQSEEAIVDAVLDALPDCDKVLDLYAGIGTLTFAAARRAKSVLAFDGADDAIKALQKAADRAQFGDRVKSEVRNLAQRPLLHQELSGFDAAIFDPPRAGAKEQSAQLAQSKIPVIVAVSCNPQTFGRDARLLAEAGYRLDWVQPIDQFLWSFHVEIVARFVFEGA